MYRLNAGVLGSGQGAGLVKSLAPIAWFRYGQGITVATGVSNWADQSGNGNDLKQATTTAQPAKQADGSILFDGSAQYLATSAFTLNQPETVYLLFKQVSWTSLDSICDGVTLNTCDVFQNSASPQLRVRAALGIGNTSDLAVGSYGVLTVVMNGASSLIQGNNGTAVTGDVGSGNMGGFTLGASGGGGNLGNIQVKEAIVFPVAHDVVTRTRVIKYLSSAGQLGL